MHKNWILNASPIIVLGKADLLKAISPLAKAWLVKESGIYTVRSTAVY